MALDAVTAGAVPGYTIRPLVRPEEWREAVRVQEVVWGAGFSERVPPAMMLVAHRLGGVVSGAFTDGGDLVGIVFGLTGPDSGSGEVVHWSDLLAVLPEHRGVGLGFALKLHQREQVLEAGIERMHWTFDPLRAGNAYLNLERLGAVVREYRVDLYGETGSPLHAGIGTDRFVATWELASERVRGRIAGRGVSRGPSPTLVPVTDDEGGLDLRALDEAVRQRVPLAVGCPVGLDRLLREAPEVARGWREGTRAAFLAAFEADYQAVGITLPPGGGSGGIAHYRLEPIR